MIGETLSLDLLDKYESRAAEELPQDREDFVVYDHTDSNVDDAYQMGVRAGEVMAARELLDDLGLRGD